MRIPLMSILLSSCTTLFGLITYSTFCADVAPNNAHQCDVTWNIEEQVVFFASKISIEYSTDLITLPAGIYIVQVGRSITKKITINH